MCFPIQFLVVLFLLASENDSDKAKILTIADIPSNVSPEIKQLITQTFSPQRSERELAAKKLGEMREHAAAAVPFLIRLARDYDPDPNIHYYDYYAENALVNIGKPAIEECIAEAKKPHSRPQLFIALHCLGRFKNNPLVTDALLEFLKDSDSAIKLAAAQALEGFTDDRVILAMINAMNDWDCNVRDSVVGWFVRSPRDPRTVEPLIQALNAFGGTERRLAIMALGNQRDRQAVPHLCKILGDKNYAPGDRRSAAEALGEIGDPSIFPLLVNIIHDQYEPTPVRCGVALGIGALRTKLPASPRMPNPDLTIYDLLEHVLKVKGNPLDLRASAAEALSNFSNMDVIPLLNQIAAEHPTDILGFSAAESAVKLTEGAVKDVSFVKAIYGYQIDPEEKSFYIPKKHDLLQKIAEHGTTWRVRLAARNGNTLIMDVPIGIVIIAFIVGSVVTLKWWRRKKNGMRLQALQSSPTENAI